MSRREGLLSYANERGREYYRIATWVFIGLAAAYSIGLRAYIAWGLPLWLDESWTAVLSSAPSFSTFSQYAWFDSNAPLYYFLIWLWPFESNLGLKVPSFVFLLATAAVAAFWRPKTITREAALVWAALLLLWQPGIGLFIDARYYALLMLVSTAQTIAFIKLQDDPTLRRACWWTGLTSLALLTHYYAALPALIQGLLYLGCHKMAAVRTWPAMLLVMPALAWGINHLPRLIVYAQPGVAWYYPVKLSDVPNLLSWPIAVNWFSGLVVAVLVGVFRTRDRIRPSTLMAIIAGFLALIGFILLGFLRPLLIDRYLIPVVPALLLAVACAVRPAGYLPLVGWFFLTMGSAAHWTEKLRERRWFGLERPAKYLPNAKRVSWRMGRTGLLVLDRRQSEAILLDAFKRNGHTVDARWGGDPMTGDALIWLFYEQDPKLSGEVRAKWNCWTFKGGYYSTLVCSRPK